MKKAFDQNVSRAKPRLKLGAPSVDPVASEARGPDDEWVYEVAAQVAGQPSAAEAPTAREVLAAAALASAQAEAEAEAEEAAKRSRMEEAFREAAGIAEPVAMPEPVAVQEEEFVTVAVGTKARGATPNGIASGGTTVVSGPAASARRADVDPRSAGRTSTSLPPPASRPSSPPPAAPVSRASSAPLPARPVSPPASAPVAADRRPAATVLTETVAPAPVARRAAPPPVAEDNAARRERLRERLRGVRENPRPEPLPTSVAAAGVLAVERIAQLQVELTQVKQHNAALQHDLDVARRAAERATEEARGRVEEARRLVAQMEERATLLGELERELQSVEGERDESLMAVQDARTDAAAEREQRERLTADLARKDVELADSLSEEERLAGELERFRDDSVQLKKSLDVLSAERDTLARQVADLTAERAELLEARKALESVHRALTEAARR
jgi:hypothetical protein